MSVEDYVYSKHCCRCPLRNYDCKFENCTVEQYKKWVEEARKELQDAKEGR